MLNQTNPDASAHTTRLGAGGARSRELTAFLRKHRAACDPVAAGFPYHARRRTPGLRREELAVLAGVSATWYTWLEQGREINVSPAVIGRIAKALHLDPIETEHLHALTAHNAEQAEPRAVALDPGIADLIERLGAIPVLVYDMHWDVVGANTMARAFLNYAAAGDPLHDNILWRMFMDSTKRTSYCDWATEAQRCVAQFRRSFGRAPADRRFEELVGALHAGSVDFDRWWNDMDVADRAREAGHVTYRRHPEVGIYGARQVTLTAAGDDSLRINVPVPMIEDGSAQKLQAYFAGLP